MPSARRDWVRVIHDVLVSLSTRRIETADARLGWLIVFATIPAGLMGVLFEHAFRTRRRPASSRSGLIGQPRGRKIDPDARSAGWPVLGAHPPTVGLDEGPHDRQPETARAGPPVPRWIGLVEAVEHARQILGGDALAGVLRPLPGRPSRSFARRAAPGRREGCGAGRCRSGRQVPGGVERHRRRRRNRARSLRKARCRRRRLLRRRHPRWLLPTSARSKLSISRDSSPASASPMVRRSSTIRLRSCVCSRMVRMCLASGGKMPSSTAPAVPSITVNGVRSSWTTSATNRRRWSSARCSEAAISSNERPTSPNSSPRSASPERRRRSPPATPRDARASRVRGLAKRPATTKPATDAARAAARATRMIVSVVSCCTCAA